MNQKNKSFEEQWTGIPDTDTRRSVEEIKTELDKYLSLRMRCFTGVEYARHLDGKITVLKWVLNER